MLVSRSSQALYHNQGLVNEGGEKRQELFWVLLLLACSQGKRQNQTIQIKDVVKRVMNHHFSHMRKDFCVLCIMKWKLVDQLNCLALTFGFQEKFVRLTDPSGRLHHIDRKGCMQKQVSRCMKTKVDSHRWKLEYRIFVRKHIL